MGEALEGLRQLLLPLLLAPLLQNPASMFAMAGLLDCCFAGLLDILTTKTEFVQGNSRLLMGSK